MSRGVSCWEEGGKTDPVCLWNYRVCRRCVDRAAGSTFRKDGDVDLPEALGRDPKTVSMSATSPVLIYKNLVIKSGLNGDYTAGDIRGFDVRTGVQKWAFHTRKWKSGREGLKSQNKRDILL